MDPDDVMVETEEGDDEEAADEGAATPKPEGTGPVKPLFQTAI